MIREEKSPRILLVEDDMDFGKIFKEYLSLKSMEVVHAKDGMEGWNAFRHHHFDLCILDVMMPHKDGFELAQQIRKHNERIPIFFLTAKGQKHDMLTGYNIGADDYITKPADADILMSKIQAVLKRQNNPLPTTTDKVHLHIGKYQFDASKRVLTIGNQKQSLTPTESHLLHILSSHLNQRVAREDLLKAVWKEANYFTGRSMDVYIAKLRKYLAKDDKVHLTSRHQGGYILEVEE